MVDDLRGATALRSWIREQVKNNTPYDRFAYRIMTATGSNKDNPAASYFKVLRTAGLTHSVGDADDRGYAGGFVDAATR